MPHIPAPPKERGKKAITPEADHILVTPFKCCMPPTVEDYKGMIARGTSHWTAYPKIPPRKPSLIQRMKTLIWR